MEGASWFLPRRSLPPGLEPRPDSAFTVIAGSVALEGTSMTEKNLKEIRRKKNEDR
jgi:hypothetical protein